MAVVQLVRRLAALPLLKLNDVDSAFDYAKESGDLTADQAMKDKIGRVVVYMEKTWISPTALFPSSLWSRYSIDGMLRPKCSICFFAKTKV